MKLTPAERQLMEDVPHMKCANRLEFQYRLQWLSEGMLRNHMEDVINYTVDQSEIERYRQFKEQSMSAAKLMLGITKKQIDSMQRKVDQLERENDAIGLTRVRHAINERLVEIRLLLRDGNLARKNGGLTECDMHEDESC